MKNKQEKKTCNDKGEWGNFVQALEYGRDTFLFAFGIAAGMSIAWSICYFLRSIRKNNGEFC